MMAMGDPPGKRQVCTQPDVTQSSVPVLERPRGSHPEAVRAVGRRLPQRKGWRERSHSTAHVPKEGIHRAAP